MGKDSILRSLASYNALWDGKTFQFDRKTSESYTVWGARLTMGLQVQEAALRDFFVKSGELARGTGFLARFLIAWPESTQGARPFREPPEGWPAVKAYNQRIAAILDSSVKMDAAGALVPAMLVFSAGAKSRLDYLP